jgi:hypothetical protein
MTKEKMHHHTTGIFPKYTSQIVDAEVSDLYTGVDKYKFVSLRTFVRFKDGDKYYLRPVNKYSKVKSSDYTDETYSAMVKQFIFECYATMQLAIHCSAIAPDGITMDELDINQEPEKDRIKNQMIY